MSHHCVVKVTAAHLLLVLALREEARLDAALRLNEGAALRCLRRVVREDARHVDARENADIGHNLNHDDLL